MRVTACRHTSPALLPQARAHRFLLLLLLHKGLLSCRAHQPQQQQHQVPARAHDSRRQVQALCHHPKSVLHQQQQLLLLHLALVLQQQQSPEEVSSGSSSSSGQSSNVPCQKQQSQQQHQLQPVPSHWAQPRSSLCSAIGQMTWLVLLLLVLLVTA
jgi:hypothetical protein